MQLMITDRKRAQITPGMIGLFFEDINYAADGGLYAEMIENRSFEFRDCYGDKGDYYTVYDGGYAWEAYPAGADVQMRCVTGSPVAEENPHYLRVTADAGEGFQNLAYDGIALKKGMEYQVSFYARCVSYDGSVRVSVEKEGMVFAEETVSLRLGRAGEAHFWDRYRLTLKAEEETEHARFVISLDMPGTVEFDFISMMPADAVCGLFRRDLFELLRELEPGFVRFPGGCIVEGNTLANRYRFKDTLKEPEHRRANWNRWAVSETTPENGFHSIYSHYNQTLGLGYYEFFLLCEALGAQPLPVLNVGLACQFQSFEMVEPGTDAFEEYVRDALDLIEFANGDAQSRWGSVRAGLGHPEPFGLMMLGIGNEQWETQASRFFERYAVFEERIHAVYPQIRLIGSAGPDVTSEKYDRAWAYYRHRCGGKKEFVHAVDEHYYVQPEWLYAHTDFYDQFPRDVKVFAGEYAAHVDESATAPGADGGKPQGEAAERADCGKNERKNCLGAALAEAAFLTGIERNADVVALASYAPLFARSGFAQWAPDLIWFDAARAYRTPGYYVQKLYSTLRGTVTLDTGGWEKETEKEQVYYHPVLNEATGKIYCRVVNAAEHPVALTPVHENRAPWSVVHMWSLGGMEKTAYNPVGEPERVTVREDLPERGGEEGSILLPGNTFAVLELA